MNAANAISLRNLAILAVALALTAVQSWSFVESTSTVRWVSPHDIATLEDESLIRLAQVDSAALVD